MARMPKEHEEYILSFREAGLSYEKIAAQVNDTFSSTYNANQIRYCYRRNKIKKKKESNPNESLRKPIGYEYVNKDGYIMVKVAESLNVTERCTSKHRLIWEKHHGKKVSPDEAIIFLDGDKRNFDIDNLRKVKRREQLYLHNLGVFAMSSEYVKTGINIAKLFYKVKEKENTY